MSEAVKLDEAALNAALLAMSEVDASSRGEAEARFCLTAGIRAYLKAVAEKSKQGASNG